MLNIQADAYYTVENPADHHIVSVRGPYGSYEAALASLSDLYRGNGGVEQIVFPVVGKWLIEEADIQCTEIDPVLLPKARMAILCDPRGAGRWCRFRVIPEQESLDGVDCNAITGLATVGSERSARTKTGLHAYGCVRNDPAVQAPRHTAVPQH